MGSDLGLKSTTVAAVCRGGWQRARTEASAHDYVHMIPGMWTPRVRKECRAALVQRRGYSWGLQGAVTSLGTTGPHPTYPLQSPGGTVQIPTIYSHCHGSRESKSRWGPGLRDFFFTELPRIFYVRPELRVTVSRQTLWGQRSLSSVRHPITSTMFFFSGASLYAYLMGPVSNSPSPTEVTPPSTPTATLTATQGKSQQRKLAAAAGTLDRNGVVRGLLGGSLGCV